MCLLRLRQRTSPAHGHRPGTRLASVSLWGLKEPEGPGRLAGSTPRADSSDAAQRSRRGGFEGPHEQPMSHV